jgi:hypothetical protein
MQEDLESFYTKLDLIKEICNETRRNYDPEHHDSTHR